MTIQQAQMAAMQLRARKPELQNMAVSDLVAQIMASEGAGQPAAGVGGLANLFATPLSPASPAPMGPGMPPAPKPTAQMFPAAGVDAYRAAKEIRDRTDQGPTVGERAAANTRVDDLIAELPKASAPRPPEVAPVRAASPVAAAMAAAEAPAKGRASRYSLRLQQKQAQLEQLKAAVPASGETPDKLAYDLDIVSREVNELANLVAAEEAAVADPERAAILERQTKRLGREEELVEQARKRAPFDALIAGGAALASARPGESFISALTRGLAAGNESYSGARDAREASLRGIEEKRDTYSLQSIDAVMKARDEAIAIQRAGGEMTEQQTRLANMSREGAEAAALAPLRRRVAEAEVTTAEVEAQYAGELKQLAVQAARQSIDSDKALAELRRRPPTGGSSAGIPKGVATFYGTLGRQATSLRDAINDPLVGQAAKKNYIMQLAVVEQQMRGIETTMGFGGTGAPAGKVISKTKI